MKKSRIRRVAVLLSVCLIAWPQFGPGEPFRSSAAAQAQNFSPDELDELLAPIALYPDPLLAQVLPASTFVDQIDEAVRVLGGKSDDNVIAKQNWDVSVKSVAHYPQVLQMMSQKQDWTIALGQAVVNQSTDVMKACQRLRAQAKEAGNLQSGKEITVEQSGESIVIAPANPEVIYVPQYDPQVVYAPPPSGPSTGAAIATGLLAFGAGMAMGAWMNNDCYWNRYGFGYHGWSGGGWVGRSASYANVNVNRNVYVNNSYRNTNLNRNINSRNINAYRGDLNRNANVRKTNTANRNRTNTNVRDNNAGRNDRVNDNRNDAFKNRDNNKAQLDGARGRDNQGAGNRQDPNRASARDNPQRTQQGGQSAFGGASNKQAATQQHNRGSQSVANRNAGGGGGGAAGNRAGGATAKQTGGASRGGGAAAKPSGGGGGGAASRGGASGGGGRK